jgi:hypothetical protein
MKTKSQVTTEFTEELLALLKKYSRDDWAAEICLNETSRSFYPVYNIEAYIPSLYDENGECIREYTEIDLGTTIG